MDFCSVCFCTLLNFMGINHMLFFLDFIPVFQLFSIFSLFYIFTKSLHKKIFKKKQKNWNCATYEFMLQHFWTFWNLNDENRSVNTSGIALWIWKKRKGRKLHLNFERGGTVSLPLYSFGTIITVLLWILLFCFQNFI